jgi:bacterioferritin
MGCRICSKISVDLNIGVSMKGDRKIIQNHNSVLKLLLTGINQYFLHARMCENWAFKKLDSRYESYSIYLMKASDKVIKRILFLEGLPNLQDLGKLYIGEDIPETIAGNMKFDIELRDSLASSINDCESMNDYISRQCLQGILHECEEQIDWLESQQFLIENEGLKNYLQTST